MTKRSKESEAMEEERKARLAAALRENLKRRKAQARGRREDESLSRPQSPEKGGEG